MAFFGLTALGPQNSFQVCVWTGARGTPGTHATDPSLMMLSALALSALDTYFCFHGLRQQRGGITGAAAASL